MASCAVCVLLMTALFSVAAGQCPPVTLAELGTTDSPSDRGLIAESYASNSSGNPAAAVPDVQVFALNIVCLGGTAARERYSMLSVVVNYSCAGVACGAESGVNLAQIELECSTSLNEGPRWVFADTVVPLRQPGRQIPANATLSTAPSQCAFCYTSLDASEQVTLPPVLVDDVRHCVECNAACVGARQCSLTAIDGCCNYFDFDDNCVTSCPSGQTPNADNDCSVYVGYEESSFTFVEGGQVQLMLGVSSNATGSARIAVNVEGDSFSILNVTVPGVAESLLPDDSVALEGDITEVISLSLANLHPLELNRRRVLFGDPSQSGLHAAANFTTADDDVVTVEFYLTEETFVEDIGIATPRFRVSSETAGSFELQVMSLPRGIEASVERSFPEINTTVTLSRPPGAPDIVPLLAINITDDQVGAEEEERAVLEVALGGTEGVRLGAQRQLSVIITDTDFVTLVFDDASIEVPEGAESDVCVRASHVLATPQTFRVFTVDNTATGGEDFEPFNETFVLPATSTSSAPPSQCVATVRALPDARPEPSEQFFIFDAVSGAEQSGQPPGAIVTILDRDSDVTLQFVQSQYVYPEGQGNASVCVQKVGQTTETIAALVRGVLQGGSPAEQQIEFAPSEMRKCVDFTVDDDSVALEPVEILTFDLVLVNTTSGVSVSSPNTTVVVIVDDDDLTITVSKDNIILESNTAPELLLTFSTQFATGFLINVAIGQNVSESNPPATPGADYAPTNDSVLIDLADSAAGQRIISGTLFDDDAVESLLECFILSVGLTTETNDAFGAVITVVNGERECCIMDNDVVQIGFNPDSYSKNETEGRILIFVEVLMGRLERSVEVELTFFASTGLVDAVVPRLLLFDASTTSVPVTVIINDDAILENNEEFFSLLSTTDAAVILDPQRANITIVEDSDVVTIGFAPINYSFAESENATARLMIISGQFAAGVSRSVRVTSASGTATSGMDFTAVSQTYTFSDTVLFNDVIVILNDDNLNELDEAFLLLASSLTSGVAIDSGAATANIAIADNDYTRIGFEQVVYSVQEDVGFVRLFIRSFTSRGVLTEDVDVALSTLADSAVAGSDYVSTNVVLTFTAGGVDEQNTIDVPIVNDTSVEDLEQFFADLVLVTTPLNVTVEPTRATVLIVDEDEAMPTPPPPPSECVWDSPSSITTARGTLTFPFNQTCEHLLLTSCAATPGPDFSVRIDSRDGTIDTARIGVFLGDNVFFMIDEDGSVAVMGSPDDYSLNSTEGRLSFALTRVGLALSFTPAGNSSSAELRLVSRLSSPCGLCGDEQGQTVLRDSTPVDPSEPAMAMRLFNEYFVNPGETLLRTEERLECGFLRTDQVIMDPLFTVPMYGQREQTLCYEVHGAAGRYFNLISDDCVSVNARYIAATDEENFAINVLGGVAVRGVDREGACVDILVEPQGVSVTRNGTTSSGEDYERAGIRVSRSPSGIAMVMVPNCEDTDLQMEVTSQTIGGTQLLNFEVLRGLNLRESSHGLIGQFWNIPIAVHKYDGPGTDPSLYIVTVTPPSSPPRSFLANLGPRTWDRTRRPCLYAGSGQAGSSNEIASPDDPVIEGHYELYATAGAFQTGFQFSHFDEARCFT